jgi:hypothetical protein
MATLPCDICHGYTGVQGSWDTPIKILCEKCIKEVNPKPIDLETINLKYIL